MWNLVHNDKEVLALIEVNADAKTETIYTLFVGSKDECESEIQRLGLTQPNAEQV